MALAPPSQGPGVLPNVRPSPFAYWHQTTYAARTLKCRRQFWQQLLEVCGAVRLSDITTRAVEDWKAARLRAGNEPSTVNAGRQALSAIFTYARNNGYWQGVNPLAAVKRLSVHTDKRPYHTEAEMLQLLEATQAHDATPTNQNRDMEAVVLLLAWAGLRHSELDSIKWSWFLWDNEDRHRNPYPIIRVVVRKDKETRDVPMAERIRDKFHPDRHRTG